MPDSDEDLDRREQRGAEGVKMWARESRRPARGEQCNKTHESRYERKLNVLSSEGLNARDICLRRQ